MRSYSKYSAFVILASSILFSVGLVSAPPIMPIGSALQTVPFEANPNAKMAGSRFVPGDTAAYDTSVSTSFRLDFQTAGYWGVTDFDRPSDFEEDEFDIGWIDIKVLYYCTGTVDDTLSIEYRVPPDSTWLVLQPAVSGTDAMNPISANTLANAWHNPLEPNDGVWTWPEVESLEVRLVTTPVGPSELPFLYWIDVYEIWVSAYPPPLPPSESTACSIQPVCGGPIGLYQYYFVDVFVTDVESLAGWEFVLHFDPAILYPVEGWVYAPWTDMAWMTLDPTGLVNIAASIDISHPLIDTGWNGSGPLARVYFATMADPAFTWLTFSKMKICLPPGGSILHGDYHGCYGTPPAGEHLLVWQYTGVDFSWSYPVCTWWIEECPDFGKEWHLTSWEDGGDERFSISDQIGMLPEPPDGNKYWYHIDVAGVVTPSANVYAILTFKYSEPSVPNHDVAVISLVAPATATVGDQVSIEVTVSNEGDFTEASNVTVYANTTEIGTQNVTGLASGSQKTLTFSWNTTDATDGNYILTANATVLESIENPEGVDEDLTDNAKTKPIKLEAVHDIAIINVEASPTKVMPGDPSTITVTIENQGDVSETFTVTAIYDDTVAASPQTVTDLAAKAIITLNFTWDTTDVAVGEYTIKAEASIVPGEDDIDDNTFVNGKVTLAHRKLSIKLAGEIDYMIRERVKVRLAALVTDAETAEPVSNANVTVEIYCPDGRLMLTSAMTERLLRAGIYEWMSNETILHLGLEKGVYLARTSASFRGGPTAYDILEFHIDPPSEDPVQLHLILSFVLATALIIAISVWYIDRRRLSRKLYELQGTKH